MASVSVRYIVDDVAAALAFYCDELDFHHGCIQLLRLQCWIAASCGLSSAHEVVRAAAGRQYRTTLSPTRRMEPIPHRSRPASQTESNCSRKSGFISATRSLTVLAGSRSSSTIAIQRRAGARQRRLAQSPARSGSRRRASVADLSRRSRRGQAPRRRHRHACFRAG
jgi:hypothetical protein